MKQRKVHQTSDACLPINILILVVPFLPRKVLAPVLTELKMARLVGDKERAQAYPTRLRLHPCTTPNLLLLCLTAVWLQSGNYHDQLILAQAVE